MKIDIKDKETKEPIMTISIPYSQDPIEAILNWCDNMNYRYVEIEWEGR